VPVVKTAFVLGGGGVLGACEVGMLKALLETGITPDVVVGTSIGALNGAFVAADPRPETAVRLEQLWRDMTAGEVFSGSLLRRAGTLARTGTHLHPFGPLRDLLRDALPIERIEELQVPFQCVAASIERAAEHWFTDGPLADAVLASCAVPGLMAPVRIGDEHFLDGGLVHSIPVGRAVALGASTVYVLQVGRVEQPLRPPRRPWEVGLVAFEIARRHRYAADMAAIPADVAVHVLPVGDEPPRYDSRAALRYRDMSTVGSRVERAYEASIAYLTEVA
jgi:NTE family protein